MNRWKKRKGAIHIRDAHKSDCEAIAGLLGELGYPSKPDFVSERLDELTKKINDGVVVATIDSQVVGVATLHILPLLHQNGNVCRVTAIVVSEKQRRKGIGTQLLAYAENYARTHQCIKVEITSGDQRTSAHQFYRRVGYKEVSRRFIKPI